MIFPCRFHYDWNASLRLILDGSLFLSLHVSSTHHCFCAIDLCVLSCLLCCRRLDLRFSRTQTHAHTHTHKHKAEDECVCTRAMANKQQRNAFDCTHIYTHTHTLRSILNWSTSSREPKRTSRTHTGAHTKWWETRGEQQHTFNCVRFCDSWKAGQQIFDYATPI